MGRTAGTEASNRGLHGMSPHCPSVRPLGTEGWDGQLGQRPTDGTPWDVPSLSVRPLGTEGLDRQLGQRPTDGTPWDVPSLSVRPLGTEGWDGQLGQRPVIEDSMGCPLTVRTSLGD